MAPYVAEPYLGHLLAQMAAYRERHEEQQGNVIPHITQVQVSGSGALVRDCQDESYVTLASTQTHQVIPGTTGLARTAYIAALARGGDGRWRLTSLQQVAIACEPTPSPSSLVTGVPWERRVGVK
jgi:hypothetical protein